MSVCLSVYYYLSVCLHKHKHAHSGRKRQFTGLAIRNTDTKIKALLKMKRQLTEVLHQSYGGYGNISELPDDCLRHIISFLSHPKDVLNFGQASL